MALEGESQECVVCRMQIPARAEVCPHCGFNQAYSRFWKGEGMMKALLIGGALGIGLAT